MHSDLKETTGTVVYTVTKCYVNKRAIQIYANEGSSTDYVLNHISKHDTLHNSYP
jgi:hypothetical protein